MKLLSTYLRKLVLKLERFLPPRRLIVVKGDALPAKMPMRSIVLAQDGREDWCVGLQCPCGCGRTIELLVIEEAHPRWDYSVDAKGSPSLHPSVWLTNGCRSHFWLKNGRIHWCH
ncbi:DUF6527 family protein [Pseudomonas chlororaphis]|uniref:DUF6527 family protein n=2 Tax=Pseudomonas chlororaphis TaxID=587753 RepID=UPI000E0C7C4A